MATGFIDEQIRPDLAAQQADNGTQQAMTNRLIALTEFIRSSPFLPNHEGVPVGRSWELHEEATNEALRAVAAIARQSRQWARDYQAPDA